MKVVFIHYATDDVGGSDASLFDLITSFDTQKINPILILKKNDPMIALYEEKGFTTYSVAFYGPPKKIFSKRAFLFLVTFLPSVLSVMLILKKEKVKVAHVNTSLNIQGGLAAFLSKTPFIWHIREIMGKGVLDSAIRKVVCTLATKNISISNAVKENFKCKETTVVYNGINLSNYTNLSKINNKNIVISCIGRFEKWKGQHILLEAINNVALFHKGIKVQFIGGPASSKPDYLKSLKKRVGELNLNSSIDFLGVRSDIPDLLSSTDILVVPTSTSEPFGRVVIEGMAAGCIVIATAAGGPLEIIQDGETGFLVAPNSVDDLSDRLIHVINEFSTLGHVMDSAKESVWINYDIKRVAAEMENIFKGVGR